MGLASGRGSLAASDRGPFPFIVAFDVRETCSVSLRNKLLLPISSFVPSISASRLDVF